MPRRRLECPDIVVDQAAETKYKTRDEAWQAIRPVLARILAQVILREPGKKGRRKRG